MASRDDGGSSSRDDDHDDDDMQVDLGDDDMQVDLAAAMGGQPDAVTTADGSAASDLAAGGLAMDAIDSVGDSAASSVGGGETGEPDSSSGDVVQRKGKKKSKNKGAHQHEAAKKHAEQGKGR